jgi:ferredoxin-NADP reductase
LRKGNILITLGTGIAPFVWVIDGIVSRDEKALMVYTNSYQDEIFYRKICKNY